MGDVGRKNSCLICSSVITTENFKVDKLDVLFLLRILLEIPQENQLIDSIKPSLYLLRICNSCGITIKSCKRIYGLICEQIEKFWEIQNKILESFSTSTSITLENNKDFTEINNTFNYNIWVGKCRRFVREHDFTGFGYPFAVHDLETLLINCAISLTDNLKDEDATTAEFNDYDDDSLPISEDPLHLLPSPISEDAPSPQDTQHGGKDSEVSIKEELESEKEDDGNDDQDDIHQSSEESIPGDEEDSNDSDYKPSPSKKPRKSNRMTTSSKRHSIKLKNNDVDSNTKKKSGELFTCDWPDCNEGKGKTFKSKEFYDNHMDKHRKTPRKKCEQCGLLFYSKYQLTYHVKLEHIQGKRRKRLPTPGSVYAVCRPVEELGVRLDAAVVDGPQEQSERRTGEVPKSKYDDIYNFVRDPTTKKFHCTWTDCSKTYVDRKDLVFHTDKHRGTPRQKCDKCPAVFYVKKVLDHHIEKVHEDGKTKKPHKCKICGKSFSCRDNLYSHNTYSHSTKAVLWKICEICGKRVASGAYRKHVETVHEGKPIVKKFNCCLCQQGYDREDRFKNHLFLKHQVWGSEEEKEEILRKREEVRKTRGQLKCPKKRCFQLFVREENLRKHVEEKHGGNWEEGEAGEEIFRFRCEECGKGFHHKGKFNDHRETHKKREEKEGSWTFRCDKCGKSFPRNGQLQDHLKTHEKKEKNWECEICKVGFVDEGKLERHRNTPQHRWRVEKAGEMKRECDVCGKRFKSGRDVGVHKKHMHKGD